MLLYHIIPKKFAYAWLLLCSFLFYLINGRGFVSMLLVSVVITYLTGLTVYAFDSKKLQKAVLIVSVALHLGILFVFKYLDFTLGLFGSGLRFDLFLPLGISFYTFQAVSYTVDVYKKKIEPEKNVLKLALYLSFFASILSGPINRAGDMLPQFSRPAAFSLDDIKYGMQKMLWGYFLKLAIAGRLAIIVDNVYADTDAYSGAAVALTAFCYMFMLYCDFEGYSQIAIGSARILGITMKENFRQPFFSLSMSEIWRRWHVSLSMWFRDYLYIPLGGSRCSVARKYFNLFVVLFLSGVWHGANLTFFIWGAVNGIFIIAGQMTANKRDAIASAVSGRLCTTDKAGALFEKVRCALKRAGVFILISYTFIYFANDTVTNALKAQAAIFTRFFSGAGWGELVSLGLGTFNLALTAVMAVFVLAADKAAYNRSCDVPSLPRNIPTAVRWAIYYALVIAILFSANLTGKEFIYSNM